MNLDGVLSALVGTDGPALGIQVCVWSRGVLHHRCAGTDGVGAALLPDTRLRISCAAKPVIARLAITTLTDLGIGLDAPLGDLLARRREALRGRVRRWTVAEVLRHDTCLVRPFGTEAALCTSATMLEDLVARTPSGPMAAVGYSEVAGWTLLARALDDLTGCDWSRCLRGRLDELGLSSLGFGGASEPVGAAPIAPGAAWVGRRWVPMLSDGAEWTRSWCNPAFGAFGTAADLAHFWTQTISQAPGDDSAEGWLSRGGTASVPRADAALGHRCAFDLGVMTGLSDFGFGPSPSARAVGHSGFLGTSFGLVDPDHRIAIGCVVVGAADPTTTIDYLRPTLVSALYRAFGPAGADG